MGRSARAGLPPPVSPMLATLGALPSGPGWQTELKWDGFRGVMRVAGDQMVISSRNDTPLQRRYPELADLPAALGGQPITLDGELVVLDPAGRPSFELMQQRLDSDPPERIVAAAPVTFIVFDLLHWGDRPLIGLPWTQRRELLEGLDLPGAHRRVQVSPVWPSSETDAVLAIVRQRRLEGLVFKRADAVYEPGRRSRAWIKAPERATTEVVIGGWVGGSGRRAGGLGSLLVGAHDEHGHLVYLGRVGTGFTDRALAALHQRLRDHDQLDSPFTPPVPHREAGGAHWVSPILVGDIEYREITSDGRLRQPSWKGLRIDRDAAGIQLPSADR